jgi:peroxiredoxin
MKSSTILTALILAAGVGLSAGAFAQPGTTPPAKPATAQPTDNHDKGAKHEKKAERKEEKKNASQGAKPGDTAPGFSLTDTDGKTVTLESFKGKVVVLEWFNADCPFSGIKHHTVNHTFNELHEQYNTKGVTFLAIVSSGKGEQGAGKEFNAAKKTELKVPYPILLDETGATGHAYGATNTPHCFVIGADGKIAYAGAIDNNRDAKKAGDKNYVKLALDAVLAGNAPETASTRAYGCAVHYSK